MAVYLVTLLLSSYFVSTRAVDSLNKILFNGDYELIDLSYPFDNETVYWPGTQKFVYTNETEDDCNGFWYAKKEFAAGEHGGTHIDAPYHFSEQGLYVGDIPLEKLIVPLIVVDVSGIVCDDPNFVLYKHHLDYILNNNSNKPFLLLFKFGWSKFYTDKAKYLGQKGNWMNLNFPGLSNEVAEWITNSYKNVVGIGVDTCSVDPGSSTTFDAHRIFANAGLYNLENVKIDENSKVLDHGCTALVLPMKLAYGTGAPVRIVAICPKPVPTGF